MYTENIRRDVLLFVRASLTNLVAAFPFYLHFGERSGRGTGAHEPAAAAEYFARSVNDYCAQLGVEPSFFAQKRVLEYGPGDTLGVALLLYAQGASRVDCVDRFPIYRATPKSAGIYRAILDSLDGEARRRAERAFVEPGNPWSGLDPAKIEYRVTRGGLSGLRAAYDVVLSRSVLALVSQLAETIADSAAVLKPDGVSIHKVDLSSHGLDRNRPLDFLTWPALAYRLMYSRKGRPNRWRVDHYQTLLRDAGLHIRKLEPTGHVSNADVEFIRPHLDCAFRDVPADLLSWLGFWMILEHPHA